MASVTCKSEATITLTGADSIKKHISQIIIRANKDNALDLNKIKQGKCGVLYLSDLSTRLTSSFTNSTTSIPKK